MTECTYFYDYSTLAMDIQISMSPLQMRYFENVLRCQEWNSSSELLEDKFRCEKRAEGQLSLIDVFWGQHAQTTIM
jgi:hypothetical protein